MAMPIDMVAELLRAVRTSRKPAAPAANQLLFFLSDPLAHAAFMVLLPVQCCWVGGPLYRELRQRKYVRLGLVRIRVEHDWRSRSRPEKSWPFALQVLPQVRGPLPSGPNGLKGFRGSFVVQLHGLAAERTQGGDSDVLHLVMRLHHQADNDDAPGDRVWTVDAGVSKSGDVVLRIPITARGTPRRRSLKA